MKTLNFSKTEVKFVSLLLPEAESKMNKIVSFSIYKKLGQIKDLNADPAWLISTDWAKQYYKLHLLLTVSVMHQNKNKGGL